MHSVVQYERIVQMRRSIRQSLTLTLLALSGPQALHAQNVDWARTGGDAGNTRYSTLDQIDRGNVARLRIACPELSKRELDVLRGILDGQTAHEIGETIGVKTSSVVTYQKRAYRRLGISSQRELFALCMQP